MKQSLLIGLAGLIMTGCVSDVKVTDIKDQDLNLTPSPSQSVNIIQPKESPMPSATPGEKITANEVLLKTSKGNIRLKLYPDQAPNTVANFANKAKSDYYKNLTFHRVEDWVIQGGDPLGTGTGGGKMTAEYNQVTFKEGSLGVARGMDKAINNDSQFFICTTDCAFLTNNYTNFGEVVEGMDVAKKIAIGDKILGVEIIK